MKLKYRDYYDMPISFYKNLIKELKDLKENSLKYNIKKLALLYDTTTEVIENLPPDELVKMFNETSFTTKQIPETKPITEIDFDDITFKIDYNPFNFSVQRYADIELTLDRKDEDVRDLYLFCILLKKDNYNYTFQTSFMEYVEDMSVVVFYSCMSFFLFNWKSFEKISQLSMKPLQNQTMKENLEATSMLLLMNLI